MKLSTNKTSRKGLNASRKKLLLAACIFLFITSLLGMTSLPKKAVYVKKFKGSRYELIVEGKPYIVKGVCYNPIPIGEPQDYDWWSDPAKPWITDGRLMKEMGVNTIRLYQSHDDPNEVRQVIRDFYNLYGIRTILGDWLGFWEYPCPFYGDKAFQEKVKKHVTDMVKLYKDEPGILMWILGNENNYSCLGTVNPWTTPEVEAEKDPRKQKAMKAEVYYSFVNDLARQVRKIDHNHPVALGNGELVGLDYANKYCPDVDVVACIIYRGKTFSNLFKSLKVTYDRPILLAEFGADAYDAFLKKQDQNMQAFFLESQWRQIYDNLYRSKEGEGNCIGGTMFEWTDEWWKHEESSPEGWKVHDTESKWSNASYYFDIKAEGNKNMNEEWFGIVSLSEEREQGLNKRVPRKAYYVIKEFWKNPAPLEKKKVNK